MKNILNKSLCVVMIILMSAICFSCKKEEKTGMWSDALYTENTTFGNGAKTFRVEVKANDRSVTFTINTDKGNLEEALVEHKLVDGEKGPYGMYIKKVNGITADYDIDQSYWALSENGKPSATGASGAEIKGGEHFEFVRTKK